ncbi:MAG TPA: hypothetical protein VMZ26_00210 [Pyrinomonadaceae bacterium]|nr:hypothetical protein [Pyrinomonadaceae bacterium]
MRVFIAAGVMMLCGVVFSYAQSTVSASETFTIEDAPDQEVVCYGKTVIVKMRAKGVLAIGGDVVVEGSVSGDVFAIGGSVIQRDGAYIGGDVFAVGGAYRPENAHPLREEGRETVMYAGYEEEIRDLSQNPSMLFAPHFSLTFLAWRILSVLFWFVLSLGLATLAPGAVSRSIARFQLSALKVVAIGVAAFLGTSIVVGGSLRFLPDPLGVIFGIMAFTLVMLAYVFGRVSLNLSVGKLILKYFAPDKNNSEVLAILIGVVAWTVLLSIPYIWPIGLFVLFSGGVGLVLTARSQRGWHAR